MFTKLTQALLTISLALLSCKALAQEDYVGVSMELRPVVELGPTPSGLTRVAVTGPSVINWCDKYVAVPPGIHLFLLDIGNWCHLIIVESPDWDPASEAESSRVVPNGWTRLDPVSGGAIVVLDYVEWTICDTPLDRY